MIEGHKLGIRVDSIECSLWSEEDVISLPVELRGVAGHHEIGKVGTGAAGFTARKHHATAGTLTRAAVRVFCLTTRATTPPASTQTRNGEFRQFGQYTPKCTKYRYDVCNQLPGLLHDVRRRGRARSIRSLNDGSTQFHARFGESHCIYTICTWAQ